MYLLCFLAGKGIVPAPFDAQEKCRHVTKLPRHDGTGEAESEIGVVEEAVLPLVQEDVTRFGGREPPQVAPAVCQKNRVDLMAHDLGQRPVRDLDVAEDDDLPELVSEKCVVGVFALFHQEMATLLDDPRALRLDVDDHLLNLRAFSSLSRWFCLQSGERTKASPGWSAKRKEEKVLEAL